MFSSVLLRGGWGTADRSLCVDSTHRVLATLGLPRTGLCMLSPSTLLRLPAAPNGAGPALSAVPVFGYSTKARIRLRLRVVSSPRLSGSCSQRLARTLPGCARLFPLQRAARAARGLAPSPRVRFAFSLCGERPGQPEVWRPLHGRAAPFPCGKGSLRKSLDRKRGLFAGWEGVTSLGLSLPLSPPRCLLSPAGMGQLFSGVSQSLCFANRRRCVPAGQFFSRSPTV